MFGILEQKGEKIIMIFPNRELKIKILAVDTRNGKNITFSLTPNAEFLNMNCEKINEVKITKFAIGTRKRKNVTFSLIPNVIFLNMKGKNADEITKFAADIAFRDRKTIFTQSDFTSFTSLCRKGKK